MSIEGILNVPMDFWKYKQNKILSSLGRFGNLIFQIAVVN